MEELPNTEVIAGDEVGTGACGLGAFGQDPYDFFVLSNAESFHQLEYGIASHNLSQTCNLSLFELVLCKEHLAVGPVEDYPR